MAENLRGWTMINTDFPGEKVEGQFEAEGLTEEVRAVYSQFNALNRQHPALQFVRGELDEITFAGRVFQEHDDDGNPENELSLLKSFVRRDPSLGRPPVVSFKVGVGVVGFSMAVIRGITGIVYDRVTTSGEFRGATFNVRMTKYVPFSLEGGEINDSRFARVKTREYYELLTQREYGDPLLGVVIQGQNPEKQNLVAGDVVKLPSLRSVRRTVVAASSDPLSTAFGRRETAQRANLLDTISRRSAGRISHIL